MGIAAVQTSNAVQPAVAVDPPLRLGAHGAAVARLQRLLVQHGFHPGPVDGSFGHRTLLAVRNFQHAHHLKVDGYVGPVTWRALEKKPASGASAPVDSFQPAAASKSRTTNLPVPFYSQLNVPNGYAHTACGPTSLAMVMAAEGKPPKSVLQVCLRAGTSKTSGTGNGQLVHAAKTYGFNPKTGSGWAGLEQSLARGHAVVVHLNTTPLHNRPYSYKGGHFIVVTGLMRDAKGHVTSVICNDPGTSHVAKGKGIHYSASEFEQAWAHNGRWFMALH